MTDKAVLISIRPKYCELIANGLKNIEVRKSRPRLETPYTCYIYCTKANKAYQTICGITALNEDELFRNPTDGIKHGNSIELMCRNDYSEDNFLNGKVIGEFICDRIEEYRAEFCDFTYPDSMNERCALNQIMKVVGYSDDDKEPLYQFETSNEEDDPNDCELIKSSKVTFNQFRKYIGETFFDKSFYGWHISSLVIYDKPKELSEFAVVDNEAVSNCEYRTRAYNNPEYTNGAVLRGGYFCSKTYDWCKKCKTKPLTRVPKSWCYVEAI